MPTQAELSGFLYNNMLESYQQAKAIQYDANTPYLCPILPSKKIIGTAEQTTFVDAFDMYPDSPYLQTSEQLANYFLANNNNLAKYEQQRIINWLASLAQQTAIMEEEASHMQQPKEVLPWLVKQFPPEMKTLFLGDFHTKRRIISFLTQLLPAVRRHYPSEPIFIFTEFLPSRFVWTLANESDNDPYGPIWKAAVDNDIHVIGLEPEYVKKNKVLFLEYKTLAGKERQASIWESAEGLRLRNEHYKKILEEYRKKYPLAKFIVLVGNLHADYNSAFSLSKNFPIDETFVVSLYPTQRLALTAAQAQDFGIQPSYTSLMSNFDFATGGTFSQNVLYWENKTSALAAGSDIQIKFPPLKIPKSPSAEP